MIYIALIVIKADLNKGLKFHELLIYAGEQDTNQKKRNINNSFCKVFGVKKLTLRTSLTAKEHILTTWTER